MATARGTRSPRSACCGPSRSCARAVVAKKTPQEAQVLAAGRLLAVEDDPLGAEAVARCAHHAQDPRPRARRRAARRGRRGVGAGAAREARTLGQGRRAARGDRERAARDRGTQIHDRIARLPRARRWPRVRCRPRRGARARARRRREADRRDRCGRRTRRAPSARSRSPSSDPDIWATVATHPHDVEKMTPDWWAVHERLARHPRVVAIGETGLDYYYDHSPREQQQDAFAPVHRARAPRQQAGRLPHPRRATRTRAAILARRSRRGRARLRDPLLHRHARRRRGVRRDGLLRVVLRHRHLQDGPAAARRGRHWFRAIAC